MPTYEIESDASFVHMSDESDGSIDSYESNESNDSENMGHLDTANVKKLFSLRENIHWQVKEERHKLLDQFYHLIEKWEGQLPDLSEIFQPEEIDWLLVQDAYNKTYIGEVPLIDFVIRTGYKDKPDLDKDGKPILRRTTAVHRAARSSRSTMCISISKLFQIYKDANFIDESGLTHFHIACKYGYKDVVKKFLELGQDPNCLAQKSVDPPLFLASKYEQEDVVELLLRGGADANLANKDGLTPLHVLCKIGGYYAFKLVELFFKINEELKKPVKVNSQDKLGQTPLHFALSHCNIGVVKVLLIKGADPNLIDEDGSTALHTICKTDRHSMFVPTFFQMVKEVNQLIKVDAVDKLGRTPLQWAVASLLPDVVDVLLNHGAEVSNFIFPTEDYFAKRYQLDCTLQMVVFPTMSIIESLENEGYELDQTTAVMIMKLFAKYGLIDDSVNVDECLRKDKEFMSIAKEQMVSPSLSFYDFLQLPPEEAEKVFTLEDYNEFTSEISHLCDESHRAYIKYLCETITRGFFRRWALELFSMKSPWLPEQFCEKMIRQLKIKDLWDMCMIATNEDTQWLDYMCTDFIKKYYNRDLNLSYSFVRSEVSVKIQIDVKY